MIKEWVNNYHPKNQLELEQVLREIMQEIALAGLQRTGFFEKAAFYGGTALRIFHGLDRFSEDLDFSLLEADSNFSLDPYLDGIIKEFISLGLEVSIKEKIKSNATSIDSAFLKSETIWKEIVLENMLFSVSPTSKPSIKIKIEVDTEPPLGFTTEEKLLLRPFSFYVKCFQVSDLFAGKMHALLFRKWKDRVKGRDWYDLEWYIRSGIALNLKHFSARAIDSGDYKTGTITKSELIELLIAKIESVNMDRIKEDIVRFIPDDTSIKIWSAHYFKDLVSKLKTS
jgi:predicted nucleotidyltransferase component of viral defense system